MRLPWRLNPLQQSMLALTEFATLLRPQLALTMALPFRNSHLPLSSQLNQIHLLNPLPNRQRSPPQSIKNHLPGVAHFSISRS